MAITKEMFDAKCLELAEYCVKEFEWESGVKDKNELAEVIQATIEDFLGLTWD